MSHCLSLPAHHHQSALSKAEKPRGEAATVTFCDVGENGPGMQQIGASAREGNFVHPSDLEKMKESFESKFGGSAKLYELQDRLPTALQSEARRATVLVLRNFANTVVGDGTADGLWDEVRRMREHGETDCKVWMRGAVKAKHARHNNVIADFEQSPDYENKAGTVVAFARFQYHELLRKVLRTWLNQPATALVAELNYYFDVGKCGIGFHGDGERDIVAGVRLGEATKHMPLFYQAYHQGAPVGKLTTISLQHGDVYVMSHVAVGTDWKRRKVVTWRHAAGNPDTCSYVKAGMKRPRE